MIQMMIMMIMIMTIIVVIMVICVLTMGQSHFWISVAVHVVTTKVDVMELEEHVAAIVVSVSVHSLDPLLTLLCMLYRSQLSCCTSAATDRGPTRT